MRRQPDSAVASSGAGLALIAGGLLLVAVDAGLGLGHLAALGLVVCLPGFSLVFLGPDRTRSLVPVFILALFLIPFPTRAAHLLKMPEAVAALAKTLMGGVGIPVSREGVLLLLPQTFYAVSDRCSGISAFFGGYAMATFVALYTRSTWRRVLALLAPWPLTVVASGVRVALLVGLAGTSDLDVLESATHGLSGIAVFWLVVLPIALLADRREIEARLR